MEQSIEKRIILSFALSLLVLLAFGWLFSPEPPDAPPPENSPVVEPAAPALAPAAEAAPPSAAEPISAEAEEDVVLEGARQRVVISNRGAVLRSVRVNDYFNEAGEPLELINAAASEAGWPLALVTGDEGLDETLATALYVAERAGAAATFRYADDGILATKVFEVDPERHLIRVQAAVSRDGRDLPVSLAWRGVFGDQAMPYDPAQANIVYMEDSSFERADAGGIEAPETLPPTRYAGVEDRYFVAMFILPSPASPSINAIPVELPAGAAPTLDLRVPHAGDPVQIYVGPKQQARLEEADPALGQVINYGFFEFLARPFLLALDWINGYVGNYGWSIIILTLLITTLFFPLRLKQQLSMLKMQKIQPQMRTLQDKYKKLKPNDPRRQEVQAEMMGLYKKHGVNPVGGCLPLLLQMPFLVAIFSLLQVAIEMRRAPWISWWIDDLSAPDPVFALPILFGVTMLASQKMMPAPADPMQARIMMLMPLMLTVMFAWSQAGLLLYWWTSTLVGAVQQYFINKYWTAPARSRSEGPPPPVPPDPPPAESPVEPGEKKRRRRK